MATKQSRTKQQGSKQGKGAQAAAAPQAADAAIAAIVPVAAWTADPETRRERSIHAAATYRANMADEAERARIEAIAEARSDVLSAVAALMVERMGAARGPHGVGEMTAAIEASPIGKNPAWMAMPATARRWTIRRVFRALTKEGAARETMEERKGRRVRCWTLI